MFKEIKIFSSYSVKDIDASKQFYSEVLGLETSHPMDQLQLHLAGGGEVFLYLKANHEAATFTVLNFSVPNLEKAMQDLSEKGVRFIIYNEEDFKTDDKGVFMGDGPKIAWFKDPSDNILSVIEEN
jgi:catechol 2,3-dioxygenase-like lactoylglutathione lyase family enzyme